MTNRIGFDLEFLLKYDGVPCPSQDIIPGTKEQPFQTANGWIHRDNVMAEVGALPAITEDEFVQRVTTVMRDLQEVLPDGITYHAEASALFNEWDLQTEEAMEFGCARDYSAWPHIAPITKRNPYDTLRSCGGHVHFDLGGRKDRGTLRKFIQVCDFYLGIPSLLFDKDLKRRSLYGPPGCYRAKPYGVEYRTLSNRWAASQEWIRWVYRSSDYILSNYKELHEIIKAVPHELLNVFNHSEDEEILKVCELVGVPELPVGEREVALWIC